MIKDQRELLLNAIEKYKTNYNDEKPFIPQIISFIKENPDCFKRSNLKGHVNGSAWLLNPNGTMALLTHHRKLNRWLQPGGHSDGNPDTWSVALREAQEESGISSIQFVSRDIFDIDIHEIPENTKKNEPSHLHYDVRFLLKAAHEDFVISEESNELKWVSVPEFKIMSPEIDSAMKRMVDKWQKYYN